jgi:monofunctional glycosyltransferase
MDMNKAGVGLVVGIGLLIILFVAGSAYWMFYDTPDFTQMKRSVEVPIRLANGEMSVKKIGPMAPGWVSRSQISNFLADAVVASEDTSFYSHSGIDMHEIKEALKKDIKEGRFARGASTLTQQVLKNVYLGNDKTIWRKLREVILAPRLEKTLSKTEILTFYLNMAEWAPGIYGCGAASQYYFGIPPADLSPKQAVFLAMLLPSPRRYHAYFRSKQLTQWANNRVDRILRIMFRMGQITEAEFQVAVQEQLWGMPALPDDAPGVPKDPGFVTDSTDEYYDKPSGAPAVKAEPLIPKPTEPVEDRETTPVPDAPAAQAVKPGAPSPKLAPSPSPESESEPEPQSEPELEADSE